MNRNYRRFIVLALVFSLLLTLFSCAKKTGGSDNSSVVSQLITNESQSTSSRSSVVTVESPKKESTASLPTEGTTNTEEVKAPAEDIETAADDDSQASVNAEAGREEALSSVVTDVVNNVVSLLNDSEGSLKEEAQAVMDEVLSAVVPFEVEIPFSYMGINADIVYSEDGLTILIPDGVTADEIDNYMSCLRSVFPSILDTAYDSTTDLVTVTYDEKSIEEAAAFYSELITYSMSYLDFVLADDGEVETVLSEEPVSDTSYRVGFTVLGDLDASLLLDNTSLTVSLSRALSGDELEEVVSVVLEYLPEFTDSVPYISEDGMVYIISYDRIDDASLLERYNTILDLLSVYADSVRKDESGEVEDETASSDNTSAVSERVDNHVTPGGDNNEKKDNELKKESSFSLFSLSAAGSAYFDFQHNTLRGTLSMRLGFSFTPSISIGVSAGYDWGNYLDAAGFFKWNIYNDLYLYLSSGYAFGFGDSKSYSSFILSGGIGFDFLLTDHFYALVEAGCTYAPLSYTKVAPSINVGLKYSF